MRLINQNVSRAQDVLGLARHVLEVLCNAEVAARLQQNARATALRFTPDAIADRCCLPQLVVGPGCGSIRRLHQTPPGPAPVDDALMLSGYVAGSSRCCTA
jgi:hypothetical protein